MDAEDEKMNAELLSSPTKKTALTGAGSGAGRFKVKLMLKLLVFALSTVALSWVFEGFRQVSQEPSVWGVLLLFAGSTLTVLTVGVYGFFMYAEEKSKGNRTRKIPLYDKWYHTLTNKDGM